MIIPPSLEVKDKCERLFDVKHPLYSLVMPKFHTIRQRLDGLTISTIWIDGKMDPSREGFRPTYDNLHGPGASTMMPFTGCWLSTGPSINGRGNLVLLFDMMDRTIIDYALEIGLLGEHCYVGSLQEIKTKVRQVRKPLYSIDDVGEDMDDLAVIPSQLSIWLNSKDTISEITRYCPVEIIKDMYEASVDDFKRLYQPGRRVFLKTCNTETAGQGVYICKDEDEFIRILELLKEKQAKFNLNRKLVIQREVIGRNASFNVFLDPNHRDEIQVVALTDQLVEADGKTYKGSINHPVTAQNVERVGHVIMDVVQHIWSRYPQAFGFLMCDYFETKEGEIVLYDPGIRPSGNTATAMAGLLAKTLTGNTPFVANFFIDTGSKGLSFDRLRKTLFPLCEIDHLAKTGVGVLPWGWNAIMGRGILIGIASDKETYDKLVAQVRGLACNNDNKNVD